MNTNLQRPNLRSPAPAPTPAVPISLTEQQKINNTLIYYGYSGTGKTREMGALADYIFTKTNGKRIRYITCDTGGWQPIQPYIDAGMIDAINIAGHPDFLLVFRALSEGYWFDPSGKLVKDPARLADTGLIIVESITSICSEIMGYYREKKLKFAQDLVAVQQLKAEDSQLSSLPINQSVSAVAQAHYSGLRDELFDRIRDFQRLLSNGVDLLCFTSHESSGQEKLAGLSRTQLGIGALGQAISPALPQRFGDMIHLDTITVNNKLEYRAYFQPHQDPELKREWPARLRMDAVLNKAILEHSEFKQGYLVLTDEEDPSARQGVTKLFRFRDQLQSTAADKIRARMERIRGSATPSE